MRKRYKVKEVLHSGRTADRGLPVWDRKYEYVIDYDCFFDYKDIVVDAPFVFYFVNNPEYVWWGMSNVVSVEEKPESKELIVETLNSIYIFEELGDYIMQERASVAFNEMTEKIQLLLEAGGVK